MRAGWTSAFLAAAAWVALTGCSDRSHHSILQPDIEMLGEWNASVMETSDTCDDTMWPILRPNVMVDEFESEHRIWVRDFGGFIDCWVMPAYEVAENSLSTFRGPYEVDFDCSPGCRIRLYSRLDLTFLPAGGFSGTEIITYEPVTAECDVPQCGYPCAEPVDHLLFGRRGSRGCGFACETTFTWLGTTAPPLVEPACGP